MLTIALSCFATPTFVDAGRFTPEPLIVQFQAGYGIIAADLDKAELLPSKDEYPREYACTFTVHRVVAQPIGNSKPFPVRVGDSVSLELDEGYACRVEEDPAVAFAHGAKYYLIVRHLKGNSYEHVDGASAVDRINDFTDKDEKFFATMRDLASLPPGKRVKGWLAVLKDPKADEKLRISVLMGLNSPIWRADAEAADAGTALRAIWNDPGSKLSIPLVERLDWVLQGVGDFRSSDDRYKGWLEHLFAHTPANLSEDNATDNLAIQMLYEFLMDHPAAVGDRLMAELSDPTWPAGFRRSISGALVHGYRMIDQPPPRWETSLQTYYAAVLPQADATILVISAFDIGYPDEAQNAGIRRRFVPNVAVRAAMLKAEDRMVKACSGPHPDPGAQNAAISLQNAFKAIDLPIKSAPGK